MFKQKPIVDASGFFFHFVLNAIFFSFIISIPYNILIEIINENLSNSVLSLVINLFMFGAYTYLIFYCTSFRVCQTKQLDRSELYILIEKITKFILIYAGIQVIGNVISIFEYFNRKIGC